jgi:hypothetical protein
MDRIWNQDFILYILTILLRGFQCRKTEHDSKDGQDG